MRYLKFFEKFCENPTIYFAHPVNIYNTDIEKKCIELINQKFKNCIIINPGDDYYQNDFKGYREKNPENYMIYFKNLVEGCSIIVYLPFRDGMIGAGVWYEIHQLSNFVDSIYEINLIDNDINNVSIDYVDQHKLSIDETRIRIKKPY